MSHQEMTADQCKPLLDGDEGYIYVDVRSTEEFQRGHAEGAHNVPLADVNPESGAMEPNPEFEKVMLAAYPKDANLILGCAMGGRSRSACHVLGAAGFTNLINLHGGFSSARDPYGTVIQAGWQEMGYASAEGESGGVPYAVVRKKLEGA